MPGTEGPGAVVKDRRRRVFFSARYWLVAVVTLVIFRLVRGLPGGCLFQRLSGDLTRRAQTRGRRGPCRLARTARPMSPARSAAPPVTLRAPVTRVWAVSAAIW